MATPRAKAAAARTPEPPIAAAPPVAREIAREAARPAMPLMPGRVVGLTQAGLPVQRAGAATGVNRFFIPPHLPPPGRSWEWKRYSCYGQTDEFYLASLYQVGWEHVRYEQHPGVFAPEFDRDGNPTKGPVLRDGQYLMDRDSKLTAEASEEETRIANERVGNSKRQYNRLDTSGTQTAAFDDTARRASFIRESHEALPPMGGGNGGPQRQPID